MMIQLADVLATLALLIALGSLVYYWIIDKRNKEFVDDLREEAKDWEIEANRWRERYKTLTKQRKKPKDTDSIISEDLVNILMAISNDDVLVSEYPTEAIVVEWLRRYELNLKPMTREEMLALDRKTNK